MKAVKTFIKPFEAPQRSEKIKHSVLIFISIQLSECTRWEGLRYFRQFPHTTPYCPNPTNQPSWFKVCVHYFLSNFYFSPNDDSPTKTMKNVYFI